MADPLDQARCRGGDVDKSDHPAFGTTRREFGLTLAALAAGQLASDQARGQGPDPQAVAVDALTDMVRSRHGKDLTAEQVRAIKLSIARKQYAAELLKKVKLQNSDEPVFVFIP
jgi:hypothetical protein